MNVEKYETLLQRLVDKTNHSALDWKESPFQDAYQVSFANYTIMIRAMKNPETESPDYVMWVFNSEGTVVDTFSHVDLGSGYYTHLQDLYQKARRQALGSDKALDEILNELDEPPP
jgi:hypothetical protein